MSNRDDKCIKRIRFSHEWSRNSLSEGYLDVEWESQESYGIYRELIMFNCSAKYSDGRHGIAKHY